MSEPCTSDRYHRCDCGSRSFKITTTTFVGQDPFYVGEVECDGCGERFGPPNFAFEIPGTSRKLSTGSDRGGSGT